MLHSLTSFTLWGRSWDFRWDELPRELRAAICALCTRSALVKLSLAALGNMVDPGEFASLMASPELADLSVWQTAPSLGSVPYPRFQLVGCQLGIAAPTLDFPIHWLVEGDAFANLQFLNLAWVPETTWHVQRLINSCPASLQEFFLEMRDDRASYTLTGSFTRSCI
jgi:hypothetical protein